MQKRISRMVQEYAGRLVYVGEGFEVEEAHVSLLLHLGRIEPEVGEPGYVKHRRKQSRERGIAR
jgi:hypothetical protein